MLRVFVSHRSFSPKITVKDEIRRTTMRATKKNETNFAVRIVTANSVARPKAPMPAQRKIHQTKKPPA